MVEAKRLALWLVSVLAAQQLLQAVAQDSSSLVASTSDNKLLCMAEMVSNVEQRCAEGQTCSPSHPLATHACSCCAWMYMLLDAHHEAAACHLPLEVLQSRVGAVDWVNRHDSSSRRWTACSNLPVRMG